MKHCFTNEEPASCAKRAVDRGVRSPLDGLDGDGNGLREPAAEYRIAA